jgi:hypothetical protein
VQRTRIAPRLEAASRRVAKGRRKSRRATSSGARSTIGIASRSGSGWAAWVRCIGPHI